MWMGRWREDWLKYVAAKLVSSCMVIYENFLPAFAAAFPEA